MVTDTERKRADAGNDTTVMTPLASDDPMLVAWKLYEQSDVFLKNREQAITSSAAPGLYGLSRAEGALWAAFCQGWAAAERDRLHDLAR